MSSTRLPAAGYGLAHIPFRFERTVLYERHVDGSNKLDWLFYQNERQQGWLPSGVYQILHMVAHVRSDAGVHGYHVVELLDFDDTFLGYMRYEAWIELSNARHLQKASLLEVLAESARTSNDTATQVAQAAQRDGPPKDRPSYPRLRSLVRRAAARMGLRPREP